MRRNPNKRQHESVPYAEATIKTLDPTATYDRSCGQKARAESSAGGIEQNEGTFKSQPLSASTCFRFSPDCLWGMGNFN